MSAAGDGLTEPLLDFIESLIRSDFHRTPKGRARGRIHDLPNASGREPGCGFTLDFGEFVVPTVREGGAPRSESPII